MLYFQRQHSEQRGSSVCASIQRRVSTLRGKRGCTEDPAVRGNWTHGRPRWTEHRENVPVPL